MSSWGLGEKAGEGGTLPNSLDEISFTLIQNPDHKTTRGKNYRSISLMNIAAIILNKIIAN